MMNSCSRKAMCKRNKHSSACDEIKEGEDIISRLPLDLLTLILSFLPEADAIRTCILSSRWRFIWVFLTSLRLVMPYCWSTEEVKNFHDFVDRILALRAGTPVKSFYLHCSKNCDYNRVYDWLCAIVKSNVEAVELRFPAERIKVNFCWDLFRTSYTLVELTLRGEFVLDVPQSELLFPCLKKLNLISIVYQLGDQTLTDLVSGCPVIEELLVERQLIGSSDNIKTFKVTSPSLKRLRISFSSCAYGIYKVVIDAPSLEYMYIMDLMSKHITFTRPLLFLVEAFIKTPSYRNTESFLANLSSAKILTVHRSTIMVLHNVGVLGLPMFHNMVKLVIGLVHHHGWTLLPGLLEIMPNLEHITFSDGLVPFPRAQHLRFTIWWNPPVEVPRCLRFALKEIVINNQEAITSENFMYIRYFLRHSYHLEKLRINAHKINPKIRDLLLKIPRRSALCCIEII